MSARRQQGLAFCDQIVSSVTNFAPGFYAAHALAPNEFATFGIIQVSYIVALGVTRSSFSSVAFVSPASASPTAAHLGSIDGVALSSALAALATLAIILPIDVGPVVGIAGTAVGMVLALVQDSVRFVSIAVGRSGDALLNDALWLASVAGGLWVLEGLPPEPSAWAISFMWLAASLPGLLLACVSVRWLPSPRNGLRFIADNGALSLSFLGEWSLKQGSATIATYSVALVGGPLTVAGIRAAQLLLGPMNVMFTGFQLALMPTVMTARDRNMSRMLIILRAASICLFLAPLALAGLVVLVPTSWLEVLVGDQANGAVSYIWPLAAALAATGLMTGSLTGLRALRAGGEMVRARALASAVTLLGGAIAYAIFSEPYAALWGLSIGALLSTLAWEVTFRRVLSRYIHGGQ